LWTIGVLKLTMAIARTIRWQHQQSATRRKRKRPLRRWPERKRKWVP
jgi:hypothetical protein